MGFLWVLAVVIDRSPYGAWQGHSLNCRMAKLFCNFDAGLLNKMLVAWHFIGKFSPESPQAGKRTPAGAHRDDFPVLWNPQCIRVHRLIEEGFRYLMLHDLLKDLRISPHCQRLRMYLLLAGRQSNLPFQSDTDRANGSIASLAVE